jgi:hypothetical protein
VRPLLTFIAPFRRQSCPLRSWPRVGVLIEVGRLEERVAMAGEIAETLIVGDEDNHIRPIGDGRFGSNAEGREDKEADCMFHGALCRFRESSG